MVDEQAAIHFVSQVAHKVMSLVIDQRMDLPVALELLDTMKCYGFLDTHPQFFDAIMTLTTLVADLNETKENAL